MSGSIDVRVGQRHRVGVFVYVAAAGAPAVGRWHRNRYGDRTIGASVMLPRSRCLSLVWGVA